MSDLYDRLDHLVDADPIGLRDLAWAEIQKLRAEVERLHEHEEIRAQAIRDHQGRLIAADAAIAEVASLTTERDQLLLQAGSGEVEIDQLRADVEHLRAERDQLREENDALHRDRQWERDRANEAARLSAEARDRADDLARQIDKLQEQVAIVEGDRTSMDLWAVNLVAEFGLEHDGEPLHMIAGHMRKLKAEALGARESMRAGLVAYYEVADLHERVGYERGVAERDALAARLERAERVVNAAAKVLLRWSGGYGWDVSAIWSLRDAINALALEERERAYTVAGRQLDAEAEVRAARVAAFDAERRRHDDDRR